ncbi:putative lipid II flippase FtsW [Gordonia caeni]|uniref:Probable peptidoglycan glycosyltransferase FtsW n=1 Tax=Gordonia caeni TaxID=1007097 RepID=A0ABP7PEV0_9ACTN
MAADDAAGNDRSAPDAPTPDPDALDPDAVTSREYDDADVETEPSDSDSGDADSGDAGGDESGGDEADGNEAGGDEDGTSGSASSGSASSGSRRRGPKPARRDPGPRPRPERAAAPTLNFTMPSIDLRAWFTTARDGVRSLMARPLTSFHLVVMLAVVLTVCGLIMVQSASSVEGYAESQSSYGAFATQTVFAILGWIVFYLVLKLPFRFFRRFATTGMVVSLVLLVLVLVPHLGVKVDGARRWFEVGGVSIQPSELAKLALCVWGAHVLAARRTVGPWGKELLIPVVPVAVLMCALIIAEPNLSTTVIILIITGALLWFSGLPVSVFAAFTGFFALAGVVAALSADYRAARVFSFLGSTQDPLGGGYQATQAQYALANGGIFGVGLGQSTAKWNYLPNAHNDFIFAILVEETGLVGGIIVVGLFLLLGYVGMRIALRSADPFLRLLTGTITVLITSQMFINVGYVVGLLPVTGIQLPLLSQGGTSMLTMLTMLGLMASAARHEPEAVVALSGNRSRNLPRLLRLPPPSAYRPGALDQARDRLNRRRTAGRVPESPRNDPRRSAPRPAAPRRAEPRRTEPRRAAPRAQGRYRAPSPQAGRPAPRTGAQRSDEIHYPARQASTRMSSDPRRSAARGRSTGSPRRTEYRQR